MRILRQTHPDVLEARGGGGILIVMGMLFLLPGLATIAAPLWDPEMRQGDDLIPRLIFGLVFTLVGSGIAFGRSGRVVDRRRRTVQTWWGLLVPLSRKQSSLDTFNTVCITRELRGGKHKHIVYPVALRGKERPVEFSAPRQYEDARQTGEQLAKFVGLPLADSSSGTEVVREAAALDESLRDKARRTGAPLVLPPAPQGMKLALTIVGNSVQAEIRPKGIQAVRYVMAAAIILLLCVPVFIALTVSRDAHIPASTRLAVTIFAWVFGALVMVSLVFVFVSETRRCTTVIASPEQLCVAERSLMKRTVRQIPSDELEELSVVQLGGGSDLALLLGLGGNITARSDRMTLTFGQGLSDEELAYLHAVIKAVLTA